MAYSDYGAYIWKNGKNITKECADTHYVWNGQKFIKNRPYSDNSVVASGHAVICFDDICIEFYKLNNPKIIYSTGKKINTEIDEGKDYKSIRRNLEITGYSLGNNEDVNLFEVRYKKDYYCVICGSQVGNGLDDTKLSKYLLKKINYNKENNSYYINCETEIDLVIDNLERREQRRFEKFLLKKFGIKPLILSLLKLNFDGIKFHWQTCKEHLEKIKWLR